MTDKQADISLSPLRITIIYLVIAGLWIAFTDELVQSLVSDSESLSALQTYKGWLYVILSGLGLFYLIKQHEKQLKTKELKLENLLSDLKSEKELKDILFERIPVMITIYDPDLETFEVNSEFMEVTGWSNEELQQEDINLLQASYPDREQREEVVDFMNTPGVGWKEFTMTTKSGEQVPTSWTNVRLTDATSVGIGIDMKEIKASQAEVRESRELLQKTFESLKSSVVLVDPANRTITDCNKATEEIFGYDREELIGNPTKKLHVSPEKYEEFDKRGASSLEENGVFQTEFTMQRKDGSHFYSDHTVTLVYDEEGNVDKVVSVVRDITEQKEYEQKLRQRQERLLRSQKIGKIGDWEFNPATEELFWSSTMYEIYERNPELGPPSFEEIKENYYSQNSKKHNDSVQRAIKNAEPYDIDLELHTDKGNKKYIRAIGIPTKNNEGEVVKLSGIVQDITERKKSEKALKERNTFIETTLENLPIGVAVNTIDNGKTTLVNNKFSEIYGWPIEVLSDVEQFFQKVYPDKQRREKIKHQVFSDMESRNPEKMQWEGISITTKEGTEKFVNNKAIPLYEQNLMISTVIDVTEQKKLEKRLKLQNRKLERAQKIAQMGYWEYDIGSDNEPAWSENLYHIYGLNPEKYEPTNESFFNMVHPDDRVDFDHLVEETITKGTTGDTFRVTQPSGETGYYQSRNELITDSEGSPSKILGIVQDVTELKKTEVKLRESEEKYRHLFKNNPEPMWIFDPDTLEFVEVNQAAVNHYGYSEKEFADMTLADIRPPKDVTAMKEDVKKHRGKTSYSEEWTHLKKDGTAIDVEVSAADVTYGSKQYRLVLINDITEQKRMQEKIIQSVIEGEDRERRRIAHELHDGLGQYLVAANMNFESIKKATDTLPEKRKRQFKTGLSLLKKALSETRSISHNLMPKAISDYGLLPALENLVHDFEQSTEIDFTFKHNISDLTLKDQSEINLYRIFQEIISNSVRHADCSNIYINLQLQQDKLTLNIEDDGIGTKLSGQHEERGLGLRSIKTRVNNLKGTLDIQSQPGQGMTTTITIPNISAFSINGDT